MVILSPDLLVTSALAVVFIEWTRRIFWVRRLGRRNPAIAPKPSGAVLGKVSVIVPARDEEKNIGRCLSLLIKQDYPDYEIIVVDDRSGDRTPHLVENFKKLSRVPFKSVRVEKLPPGWTGKNHAMMVGSKAASGEWLLFTDADTSHSEHSVGSALKTAVENRIDFLTLAPEVECGSFWENTVQPLATSSLALWFNTTELNYDDAVTVLGNGQYILARRSAYEAVGGSESVKNEVVEDVELAKKFKQGGFRVRFLNGTLLYSTRMYTSLAQIIRGWTRIFIHLFEKKLVPILHKIALFVFFSIFPFVVLIVEIALAAFGHPAYSPTAAAASLLVCLWILVVRFFGNRMVRTNPWYALSHLLGSFIMVWILVKCAARIVLKRQSEWRGDRY